MGNNLPVRVVVDNNSWPTHAAEYICLKIVPEWQELFLKKNADYGDNSDDLGVRGQFSDIHRKLKKLRRGLWEGQKLTGEQPREICLDLIGHLFLTIQMIDEEGEK